MSTNLESATTHTVDIRVRRALALSVGLFLFAVYLLIYRGGFHSVDEVSMFAVTESLVKFGRANTDQIAWTQWTTTQAEAQGFFGPDGHVYSKKGLALSLAQIPLAALALLVPAIGVLQTVSLLNALLTALTGLLLFMFAWRMGYPARVSVGVALIFGLATIGAVYAKYLFSEPLAAFLLLLAAYMLFAYRQEGGLRHVVIAGLAAGFAVLTRANNLFLLPVFGLYLLWVANERLRVPPNRSPLVAALSVLFHPAAVAFVVSLLIPGAILLAYNALRSGNPLQTGYDLTLFSANIPLGLYKLLFSPLRGFFIYSPILLLSIPGWWRLRRRFAAEAWLFLGLAAVTVGLFSAWSSGEGLSWGSRFLVPVTPFFALCLIPMLPPFTGKAGTQHAPRNTHRIFDWLFYPLLALSTAIQLLGVVINPWTYLARLQAEFGGEFFLEKTAALTDFRTSQIVGQLQSFAVENSDLVWWQPWGFDGLAFGLSAALVLLTGGLLLRNLRAAESAPGRPAPRTGLFLLVAAVLTVLLSLFLLARYARTDLQFGPPNDGYTQALNRIAQTRPAAPVVTVAQYHYHVPMNRFKARIPLTGFAQKTWPPPLTALPLLTDATRAGDTWLVTVGFPPAASDNAAEAWLARNTAKISDEWLPNDTRLVRFTATLPTERRPIGLNFGDALTLTDVALLPQLRPGDSLSVEFVWQTRQQPAADYNLFLQLLNRDGLPAAEHNGPPVGGYAPTSTWPAGNAVISRHGLALPPDLPPGDYRLIAGWVNPATGQRLPTDSGADFAELGNVAINNEQ